VRLLASLGLLLSFLLGCGSGGPDEPVVPPAGPPTATRAERPVLTFGEEVVVSVSGRGVVTTDPAGLLCGNDGDQRSCDASFPDAQVVLRAKANPQWIFQGWVFVVDEGSLEYDPPPLGLDLGSPELVLPGGSRTRAGGGQRAVRHRVTALFAPTSDAG